MKELYMAHRFWYSLWYLFTVEHNLLNALNVEADSDFYLKFYFFGIFVYKNGQKASPLNRFVPI